MADSASPLSNGKNRDKLFQKLLLSCTRRSYATWLPSPDQRPKVPVLGALKNSGESSDKIALMLSVHRWAVYRELRRKTEPKGYRHEEAQERAQERKKTSTCNNLKMTTQLIEIIEDKLRLQWSPEQISGWMRRELAGKSVSYETIYKHIWKGKLDGGILYRELRHNGKKYNKRGSGKAGRGSIPGRIDIAERPAIVDEKSRLDDWEIDTIIGRERKGVIVFMVERHSKLTFLAKTPRKTSQEVRAALVSRLKEVKDSVLTITADNGKEFSDHQAVRDELGAIVYFARPYHSWEGGLNEHTNGLVR